MTDSGNDSLRARRLSARDFEEKTGIADTLEKAHGQADKIIAEAREKALRIREESEKEAKEQRQSLFSIADKSLIDFVNKAQIEKSAEAFSEMLSASVHLRKEFDTMRPWLVDLIIQSVEQILGTIDPKDRMQKQIQQGLSDTRLRWNLILRVHPDDKTLLEDVMRDNSDSFATISEVQADSDLVRGSCLLVGDGGVLDLSLSTQLLELKKLLSDAGSGIVA